MKTSFCVHAWNEADALRRLITSSFPLADLIGEWVVVDHHSTDDTSYVLADLSWDLAKLGVTLEVIHEPRPLSADFTFADLRTLAIKACSCDVIVLHDADFILGPTFRRLVETAAFAITARRSTLHGASYAIPVVWDGLETDAEGRLTSHGRVWVHRARQRIFRRGAVHYEQTKDRGRWEQLVASRKYPGKLTMTATRRPAPSSVLSVNVKSAERIALRDTMTMFMQDAVQGRVSGSWLDNYAAGNVRVQPPYDYEARADLRGQVFFAPGLSLG